MLNELRIYIQCLKFIVTLRYDCVIDYIILFIFNKLICSATQYTVCNPTALLIWSVWEKIPKIIYICFSLQVLGIICMSLASPAYLTSTHWFLFVVVTAFVASLLWVAVYFLGVREVLHLSVNWILTVKFRERFFLFILIRFSNAP